MRVGVHDKKEAVQDERAFPGARRYDSKWSHLQAWIEPETRFAVASGNQQMFENGRPGQAFCIAIAGECGSRMEFHCRRERGEKDELVLLSGVTVCQNLACRSRDKTGSA